jgi:AbrB family looped-hinge helix DNA binding protein
MRTTIDRVGRIVVPKPLRDRLRLRGGEALDIEERDGVLELRIAPAEVRVIETPEGPVARHIGDVPPLTDEAVWETTERLRR